MKVVCIGDSITAGQYVDPDVRWTSILQARLGPGFEVVNRGVSNDTTRLGLERFPADVQREQPDVVLIQFGANDCNRWDTDQGLPRVSQLAFIANLHEMVGRARHFGARAVCLLTICPTRKGDPFEEWARTYSTAIRVHGTAPIIEVRGFDWPDFCYLPDGIHLSPLGHEQYASIVENGIATKVGAMTAADHFGLVVKGLA